MPQALKTKILSMVYLNTYCEVPDPEQSTSRGTANWLPRNWFSQQASIAKCDFMLATPLLDSGIGRIRPFAVYSLIRLRFSQQNCS